MRTPLTLAAVLAVCVSAPSAVAAQDTSERQLVAVTTIEVEPASVADIMGVAQKIAAAAKAAHLAQEYGWTFWNNVYRYTFVSQFHVEDILDPNAGMSRFQGTAGEAMVAEAMQAFQNVGIRSTVAEVLEVVPEWTYLPAGMTELPAAPAANANVFEVFVKNGAEQQFDELVKEFYGFFKEMGYAFPIIGHRVILGEARTSFVTPYDDRAAFFGEGDINALVMKHGAGARWQELLGKMSQLTTAANIPSDWVYMPDMSYVGPEY